MKALLLLAAATAAHSGARFDLLCVGSYRSVGETTATLRQPYVEHLRIDLSNQIWCDAGCSSPKRIFDQSPDLLTLADELDEGLGGETVMRTIHVINRRTGAESLTVENGDVRTSYIGGCIKRPFSGFPEVRRRF